jgi:nicotinate-nucleotide pyrophosphorylase (carboxylating)
MMEPAPLNPILYEPIVRLALEEDLGRRGDLTTDLVVPAAACVRAMLVARSAGRIAGLPIAAAVFLMLDATTGIDLFGGDGRDAAAGEVVAAIEGPASSILMAERSALNFLGHLSGIATATCEFVKAVADYPAQIVCTRKTTPGLRALEKYAVRTGGGSNHRFGLDDAVLIKDNHLAIAGGIATAVERARKSIGHLVKIEVEVATLDELDEALRANVDAVLLDNMTIESMATAVAMASGRAVTEASGSIALATAAEIAETGVDLISVGWITHSAPALDVALDIETA